MQRFSSNPANAAALLGGALTLLGACGEGPTGERPLPAEIRLLTSPTLSGTPGWPLADSVVVEVLDAQGNALPGVPVGWNAVNAGDKLGRAADTTNVAGRVSAEWTLGLTEGEQTLTITVGQLDAVTVTATATIFHAASVTVGYQFACALDESGRAYCWGINHQGQLGNGTVGDPRLVPEPVAGDLTFTALTASDTHVCGLVSDGTAYCWGGNESGQVGNGALSPSVPTPTPVQTTLHFIQISAEGLHAVSSSTCGLTASGQAWCWGDNRLGKLGDGTTMRSAVPVQVQAPVPFSSILTGWFNACGLAASGELWCWGEQEGDPGALGARPAGVYSTPVAVHEDFRFVRIATTRNSACGLTAQNAAYCWGSDQFGNLGQGQLAQPTAVPLPVVGGHAFTAISSTFFEELHALTPDGAVYRWGSPGGDDVQASPVLVAQVGFTQMDSGVFPFDPVYGGYASCGVIPDGAAYCVRDDGLVRGVPAAAIP